MLSAGRRVEARESLVTEEQAIMIRNIEAVFFAGDIGERADRLCERILREAKAGRRSHTSAQALQRAGNMIRYAGLVLDGDEEACSAWNEAEMAPSKTWISSTQAHSWLVSRRRISE